MLYIANMSSGLILTARNSSCGKVMFSQVSVSHSVHLCGGGIGISGSRSLLGGRNLSWRRG